MLSWALNPELLRPCDFARQKSLSPMSSIRSLFVFFAGFFATFSRAFARGRTPSQSLLRSEARAHKKMFGSAVRSQPEWGHGVATIKFFGFSAALGATLLLSSAQRSPEFSSPGFLPNFLSIAPSSRVKTAILFGSLLFILGMKAIEAFHSARQRVRAWEETPTRSTWSQALLDSCASAEAQAFRAARKNRAEAIRRAKDAVAIERAANAGRKAFRVKKGAEKAARHATLRSAGASAGQGAACAPRKTRRL